MNNHPNVFSPQGFAIFIWMVIVLVGYYIFHKPISLQTSSEILGILFQIFVVCIFLISAASIGKFFLPEGMIRPGSRIALQIGFGLGIFSIIYYAAGVIIGTSSWLGWILLITLFVIGYKNYKLILADLRNLLKGLEPLSRFSKWLIFFSMAALSLTVTFAVSPPIKFDALVYHLALPYTYIQKGGIHFIPENFYWGMPQIGESLFTWIITLTGSLESAAILGWFAGVIALVGLHSYTEQRLGENMGWVSVAITLSGATILKSLSWAYVDWFAILFGIGLLICLDLAIVNHKKRSLHWNLFAGVFAGFALGTKYTAGAGVIAGLLCIFFLGLDRQNFRYKIQNLTVYLLAALISFSPWLVKNFIATGNPAYPFIFPAGSMTPLRISLYTGLPPWGGLENVFLLPWQAVTTGVENAPGYAADLGPLFLVFCFFAGLGYRTRPSVEKSVLKLHMIYAVTGILIWAIAGRLSGLLIQSRLYFVLFPAFAVLAAAGFQAIKNVDWPGVRMGRIAGVVLWTAFALNIFQVGVDVIQRSTFSQLLGLSDKNTYLENNLGMYQLAMNAIQDLPESSKVLMLFEPRGLACTGICDSDEILDHWFVDLEQSENQPDQVIRNWRKAGYSHVLFYQSGSELFRADPRFSEDSWYLLDVVLSELEIQVNLDQIYSLYKIP